MVETPLTLTPTGADPKGQIVGILDSPAGRFEMTATEEGWADLERHVAAGRNPVLLSTHLAGTTNTEEINS